jgi:hypothetical protein
MSLGTVLHLGGVPLKGLIMGSLGLFCLVTLRRLQPQAGVCLAAGIVAVFLIVFTMGGVYPGPVIGIFCEALIVELAFLATRSRAVGAMLAGACALAVNPLQMVLMTWVVAGPEAVKAALNAVQNMAQKVGMAGLSGTAILGAVVAISAGIGFGVGAAAWVLAGRVQRRLGRTP